jgi:hypothetical protein
MHSHRLAGLGGADERDQRGEVAGGVGVALRGVVAQRSRGPARQARAAR